MFGSTALTAAMPPGAERAANDTFRSTDILPYRRPARRAMKTAQPAGGREKSAADREDIRRRNRLIALANAQARLENERRELLHDERRTYRYA